MEIASSSPFLNREIFDQVLCMDDGDDHEFSKSLIENFFEQAEETFVKMNDAINTKNLTELGHLGHFLKGSSAALGFDRLKDVCERMQHYGKCRDVDGRVEISPEHALELCKGCLEACLVYYKEVREFFDRAYSSPNLESFLNSYGNKM